MSDRLAQIDKELNDLGITTSSITPRSYPTPPQYPGAPKPSPLPIKRDVEEMAEKTQYLTPRETTPDVNNFMKAVNNLKMGVAQGIVNEFEAVENLKMLSIG
jgi:hypothetical protein